MRIVAEPSTLLHGVSGACVNSEQLETEMINIPDDLHGTLWVVGS
jgi:hypothetical protein